MQIKRLPVPKKPPSLGELDTPVALYSAEMTPDDYDGFSINLTHEANLWANVVYGFATYAEGGAQDNDPEAANLYVVQATGISPKKGDYLIHDDTQYKVVHTKPIDSKKAWLAIYAVEAGLAKQGDFTADKPATDPIESENLTDKPIEDLWAD